MSSALRRVDVVNKSIDILCIGIIVLYGYFHIHFFLGSLTVNYRLIKLFVTLV